MSGRVGTCTCCMVDTLFNASFLILLSHYHKRLDGQEMSILCILCMHNLKILIIFRNSKKKKSVGGASPYVLNYIPDARHINVVIRSDKQYTRFGVKSNLTFIRDLRSQKVDLTLSVSWLFHSFSKHR